MADVLADVHSHVHIRIFVCNYMGVVNNNSNIQYVFYMYMICTLMVYRVFQNNVLVFKAIMPRYILRKKVVMNL